MSQSLSLHSLMTSITASASRPLVSEFVNEELVLVGLFLLESDGRRQVKGPNPVGSSSSAGDKSGFRV